MSSRNKNNLRVFERRILRNIHGPVLDNNGTWRIKMNQKLDQLIDVADIVRFTKVQIGLDI